MRQVNVSLLRGSLPHVDLIVWREGPDPNVLLALVQIEVGKLEWKEFSVGEMPPPLLRLSKNVAGRTFWQQLANQLYEQFDIVAEGKEVSAGELGATKAHLEDFRTIVFGFDDVQLHRFSPMVKSSEAEGEDEDAEI